MLKFAEALEVVPKCPGGSKRKGVHGFCLFCWCFFFFLISGKHVFVLTLFFVFFFVSVFSVVFKQTYKQGNDVFFFFP